MPQSNVEFSTAVRGFAQLQRALGRIEDGTQAQFRQRLRDIGDKVSLVAASNAPRGATGELQHSIKSSVTARGASIYSTSVYGGAQNYGAMVHGRGPHIKRANASHYMDRTVSELQPWVEQEMNSLIDWVISTLEDG